MALCAVPTAVHNARFQLASLMQFAGIHDGIGMATHPLTLTKR